LLSSDIITQKTFQTPKKCSPLRITEHEYKGTWLPLEYPCPSNDARQKRTSSYEINNIPNKKESIHFYILNVSLYTQQDLKVYSNLN